MVDGMAASVGFKNLDFEKFLLPTETTLYQFRKKNLPQQFQGRNHSGLMLKKKV